MSPSRHLKMRLVATPCRCLLAASVLLGQIGLPNWRCSATIDAKSEEETATSAAGCQCPPTVRRVGRCCCALNKAGNSKSCCTQPTTQVAARKGSCCQQKGSKSKSTKENRSLVVRRDCPCGSGSDAGANRCTDPRVLPPPIEVSLDGVGICLHAAFNDRVCGELSPPPLPPPKA